MMRLICLQETELAKIVASKLNLPLNVAQFQTFSDGEINVVLEDHEKYTGSTTIILQSNGRPVNETTLGIAFLAQELKNAGAQKVIAVTPYFGYARQECSTISGKPGHAAVVAKLFEASGIDELIAVELHDLKIIDMFAIPVINLTVEPIIAAHIKEQMDQDSMLEQTCLVAPDKGIADYVKKVAGQLGVGTVIFTKERFAADQTRVTNISDECHGSIGIVIDDIIATGSTALNVCNSLPERGYEKIYGYFVHPVLSGNAVERIEESCFDMVFVGNTLPLPLHAKNKPFIKTFDVSSVIVNALKKIIT